MAPVSAAPNERSAVVRRRPPAVTDSWSAKAAATRASRAEAGTRGVSRSAEAGSARRAADAAHGAAPMTGVEFGAGDGERRQQPARLPDDLADGPGAHGRQLAAEVLGQVEHVALDHLGRAGELGPQVLALGGDAGRARIEVALAGHVAADRRRAPPSRTRTPRRR